MSEKAKKEENSNIAETPKPLIEDEFLPEEEPDHPGWLSIAEILKVSHPVFENSKFLIGYHFSSNVYVLAGDYLTIVDPGNDYTAFRDFDALGYDVLDIRKIVVTHGHRDHCMGVFEILRFPPIFENKQVEIVIHAGGPEEFKKILTETGFTITEVKGGETLELSGFEWEVIHTPGHTIDSMCLYHAPTKTAITGDTVLPELVGDVDRAAGGRLDHYVYGIRQLMQKDIAHVLPGHGVPVAVTGNRTVEGTYEAVMMKIIGVEPEEKITWMDGASLLAEKGLLEEVVYCCDKELALRPGSKNAMQLKAFALNDMGRCEEAVQLLDEILREHPDDVHTLTAKGHALLGLSKYRESLPFFDDALKYKPDFKDAQVFKGMALYFLGEIEEAMKIEAFKTEFLQRFAQEINKKKQSPTQQSSPQGG